MNITTVSILMVPLLVTKTVRSLLLVRVERPTASVLVYICTLAMQLALRPPAVTLLLLVLEVRCPAVALMVRIVAS